METFILLFTATLLIVSFLAHRFAINGLRQDIARLSARQVTFANELAEAKSQCARLKDLVDELNPLLTELDTEFETLTTELAGEFQQVRAQAYKTQEQVDRLQLDQDSVTNMTRSLIESWKKPVKVTVAKGVMKSTRKPRAKKS